MNIPEIQKKMSTNRSNPEASTTAPISWIGPGLAQQSLCSASRLESMMMLIVFDNIDSIDNLYK